MLDDPFEAVKKAASDSQSRGDLPGAISILERALASTETKFSVWKGMARTQLARLYWSAGELPFALSVCEQAIRECVGVGSTAALSDAHLLRANLLWHLGHTSASDAALDDAWSAAETIEKIGDRLLFKSFVLFAQGQFESCLTILSAVLQGATLSQYESGVRQNRFAIAALCALYLGRPAEALELARRSHRVQPSITSCELLALAHSQQNLWDAALYWRLQQLELAEKDATSAQIANAQASVAQAFTLQGRCTDALDLLDAAEKIAPGNKEAGRVRFHVYLALGRTDEALALWEADLDEERTEELPWVRERAGERLYRRALVANYQEDFAAALVFAEQAQETAIPVLRAGRVFTLISVLIGLGRLDDAESVLGMVKKEHFSEAVYLQVGFHVASAGLLMVRERWLEAIESLKTGLRLAAQTIDAAMLWTHLGDCYEKLGHTDAARLAWTNATKTNVESHWVQKAQDRLEAE